MSTFAARFFVFQISYYMYVFEICYYVYLKCTFNYFESSSVYLNLVKSKFEISPLDKLVLAHHLRKHLQGKSGECFLSLTFSLLLLTFQLIHDFSINLKLLFSLF